MKLLFILSVFIVMTSAQASQVDGLDNKSETPICTAINPGVTGAITLQQDNQGSGTGTFRLFFMHGETLIHSSSGNFKINAGDGMYWATLTDDNYPAGVLTWHEPTSSMTPTIRLPEPGGNITLKLRCRGLSSL